MTVAQVRTLLLHAPDVQQVIDAESPQTEKKTTAALPLWPYTWGRGFRFLSFPVDLLYRFGVTRTVVMGREHLADLPPRVIFAGTHHSFPDLALVRYALSRGGGAHAAAAGHRHSRGGFQQWRAAARQRAWTLPVVRHPGARPVSTAAARRHRGQPARAGAGGGRGQ